jgi:hypothetical protein
MIRFHMVISGFTWLRLGYIRARSLIMYPYVPNKHDLFPCVNDQRKFQQYLNTVSGYGDNKIFLYYSFVYFTSIFQIQSKD